MLVVKKEQVAAVATPARAGVTQIAKRGDTLWDIARAHGADFAETKTLNHHLSSRLHPYWLEPGDLVRLPAAATSSAQSKAQSTAGKVTKNESSATQSCPGRFFLTLQVDKATGVSGGGGNLSERGIQSSLLPVTVGVSIDVAGDSDPRPVSETIEYLGKPSKRVYELGKEAFESLRNVFLWAYDMRASFWRSDLHDGYAVGRIRIPALRSNAGPVTKHPLTGVALACEGIELVLSCGMLQSSADFIRDHMIANANSDKIPTTAASWAWRANNGRPWDYKVHVRSVWADNVRLGNFTEAVDTGSFSNLHYGYVAAAGGLSLEETMNISDWGQRLTHASQILDGDPSEDKFAVKRGHDLFVKHNGPIVSGWADGVAPTGTFGLGLKAVKVPVPIKQEISEHLTRSDVVEFLMEYQAAWNVLK